MVFGAVVPGPVALSSKTVVVEALFGLRCFASVFGGYFPVFAIPLENVSSPAPTPPFPLVL